MTTENNITASVIIAHLPEGGGFASKHNKNKQMPVRPLRKLQDIHTVEEYCERNRSIVLIHNEDKSCLIRAIILATKYANSEKNLHRLLFLNNQQLKQEADILGKKLNIDLNVK